MPEVRLQNSAYRGTAVQPVAVSRVRNKDDKNIIQRKEDDIMPGGDRTGPLGFGPMTGRGAGFCAGYSVPGYMNPVPGAGYRGWGRGRGGGFGFGGGWGRGRRNRFYATGLTGWQRAAWAPAWGGAYPYSYPPAAPVITREQELDALKSQAAYFEDALKDIQRQIEEIQSGSKEE